MKMSNMIIGNVYVALDKKAEAVPEIRKAIGDAFRSLKDRRPELFLDWDLDMDEIDGFDEEEA